MNNFLIILMTLAVSMPAMANAKKKKCYDDAKAAHAATLKPLQDQYKGIAAKYDHAQKQAREMKERVETMKKAGEPAAKINAVEKLAKEKADKEVEVFKQRMNAQKKYDDAKILADKKQTEDSGKCGQMK